jgi:hypothetical protein
MINTNVRNVLEARIHESFTVAADQLFGRGVIDRPTRISLSGLIGEMLDNFGTAVGVALEQTPVDADTANAIMTRDKASTAMWRDSDSGLWNWIGIPSNNIQDEGYPQHIISADAHRFMVSAVDSGFYREIFGKPAPELWPWHLPYPIGDTLMMAYDERGFPITAGVQKPGAKYARWFELFSKVDEPLGMSHGVPAGLYGVDPHDEQIITWYLSEEFSVLPVKFAANHRTAWMAK